MIIVDDPSVTEYEKNRQWLCGIDTKSRIFDWDEVLGLRAAGVPHLEEKPETVNYRKAILARRKEIAA